MKIIWCVKTTEEKRFSYDWLKEILRFDIEYDDSKRGYTLFEDNVYIVWCNQEYEQGFVNYINEYNKRGLNYSIVHLSDEAFEQDIEFYKISKKIIRNYYNKSYTNNYNIYTFPLGYQTGVKYHSESLRKFQFNFIGEIKSDRKEMVNIFFKGDKESILHLTTRWADPNGINPNDYGKFLSSSQFTICPRGWVNLDSFRLYEALECGSIPISILDSDGFDYFINIFGSGHPLMIFKNWQDAYNNVTSMKDEDIIYKLKEIKDFWKTFKQTLSKNIANFI